MHLGFVMDALHAELWALHQAAEAAFGGEWWTDSGRIATPSTGSSNEQRQRRLINLLTGSPSSEPAIE